jgi:hypothetical protein
MGQSLSPTSLTNQSNAIDRSCLSRIVVLLLHWPKMWNRPLKSPSQRRQSPRSLRLSFHARRHCVLRSLRDLCVRRRLGSRALLLEALRVTPRHRGLRVQLWRHIPLLLSQLLLSRNGRQFRAPRGLRKLRRGRLQLKGRSFRGETYPFSIRNRGKLSRHPGKDQSRRTGRARRPCRELLDPPRHPGLRVHRSAVLPCRELRVPKASLRVAHRERLLPRSVHRSQDNRRLGP